MLAAFALAATGCSRTTAPPRATPQPAPQPTRTAQQPPSENPIQRAFIGGPDIGSQSRLQLARGPAPVPQSEHGRFPTAPVIALPHAKPVIYNVMVSPTTVRPGEVVVGTVTTTSNVASVVATVRGITVAVPRVGYGRFALAYRLPNVVPPTFNGTYALTVIARNVDGTAAMRSVDVTLR
jgi:hypothetical protein